MSEAIKTERGTVHFITNHKPRAVVSYFDLPEAEQKDFDYTDEQERADYRFFEYLVSIAKRSEVPAASRGIKKWRSFIIFLKSSSFSLIT